MTLHRLVFSTAMLAVASCPALAQGIMKREPAIGQLRPGEIVFVDDGSCPRGKIKKVTGGSGHIPGRPAMRNAPPRLRECIVRPPWD